MKERIFEYTDYRKFLGDYYAFHKQNTPGFSHRVFLHRAGMTGPNYLKNVIDGKKNLSIPGIDKFARAMDLTSPEARYFRSLVLFNQATSPVKKRSYFRELSEFSNRAEVHKIRNDQFEYFKHWYNVAIREHINARPFSGDYSALAKSIFPPITPQQAEEAVNLLLKLGLIQKREDNTYRLTSPIITTEPEIHDIGAHEYHKSMLELSKKALEKIPVQKRYYRAITASCSQDTYDKIKLELDNARKRVLDLIAADEGEKQVIQLNMQLFPISAPPKKRKSQKDQI